MAKHRPRKGKALAMRTDPIYLALREFFGDGQQAGNIASALYRRGITTLEEVRRMSLVEICSLDELAMKERNHLSATRTRLLGEAGQLALSGGWCPACGKKLLWSGKEWIQHTEGYHLVLRRIYLLVLHWYMTRTIERRENG